MSLTPYEWYNKQIVDKLKRERMTAVDWFVKTITDKHDKSFIDFYRAEIEEAKAMEKEQIKDAYWNGTMHISKEQALSDAEKFYNEYYKD